MATAAEALAVVERTAAFYAPDSGDHLAVPRTPGPGPARRARGRGALVGDHGPGGGDIHGRGLPLVGRRVPVDGGVLGRGHGRLVLAEEAELGELGPHGPVEQPVERDPDAVAGRRQGEQVQPGGRGSPPRATPKGEATASKPPRSTRSRGRGGGRDRLAEAERGGHVAGGQLALALGVLGRLPGELAGPGQVGDGGGRRRRTRRGAGHGQVGPDPEPTSLGGQPERLGSWARCTSTRTRWVGIVSPSDSRTPSAVASSTLVPSRTSTPRRRSTSVASSPSRRPSSGSTRGPGRPAPSAAPRAAAAGSRRPPSR